MLIVADSPAALEGCDPPTSTTPRTVVVYGGYVRDALGSYRERYDEAAARVAVLEKEEADRRIYLQSLLEEDSGDRPPVQRSVEDQRLIDDLKIEGIE